MAIYKISNTGLDTNNGVSAPWATISKVNSSTFLAGDSVLFECGGVWREQLTIPSSGNDTNKISIGSYGLSSALPIFYGSNILTGFSLYSGSTYSKASVTTAVRVCYYNGAKLTKGASADTLSIGQFFWASNVLYVNVGESPTGLLEAGQRSKCVYGLSKNYLDISEIDARHANTDWEAAIFVYDNTTGVNDISIHDCSIIGSAFGGYWVKGNSGVDVYSCSATGCDAIAGKVTAVSSGINCNVYGNVFTLNNQGIYVADFSNVDVYGNDVNNTVLSGVVVEPNASAGITNVDVYDNDVTGTCTGVAAHSIQIGGATGKTVTGGSVYLNRINGTEQNQPTTNYDGYGIDLDYGCTGLLVYANRVNDCDGGGIGAVGNATGNFIFNNLITNCGLGGTYSRAGYVCGSNGNTFAKNLISGCYYGMRFSNSVSSGNVFDNIIISCVSKVLSSTTGSVVDYIDNNIYYNNNGLVYEWNGVAYTTFESYIAASGESNSQYTDPMLDVAHFPVTGSPCIGKGSAPRNSNLIGLDAVGNAYPYTGSLGSSIGPCEGLYSAPKTGFSPWTTFDGTLQPLTTEDGFNLTRTVVSNGPLTPSQIGKWVVGEVRYLTLPSGNYLKLPSEG